VSRRYISPVYRAISYAESALGLRVLGMRGWHVVWWIGPPTPQNGSNRRFRTRTRAARSAPRGARARPRPRGPAARAIVGPTAENRSGRNRRARRRGVVVVDLAGVICISQSLSNPPIPTLQPPNLHLPIFSIPQLSVPTPSPPVSLTWNNIAHRPKFGI
jgi:hypothetical protein